MSRAKTVNHAQIPFTFGPSFLHDHLGQIIDDPTVAIVELVANCYDAGADRVDIRWPEMPGQPLSITDNGTGMTHEEFLRRWRTLSYDRAGEQGTEVVFPPDVTKRKRTAFGHNGRGRFSPFCFADDYYVDSWRDDRGFRATVRMTSGSTAPFACTIDKEFAREGHGTCISVKAQKNVLPSLHVADLIGFRFAVDPSFQVWVNDEAVKLLNLASIASREIEVDHYGKVTLHRLDPHRQERTMRLKGIAWWVNKRMVGEPSWDGLEEEGKYLDGRTSEAKRFSFVVEADILKDSVKSDWSGFHAGARLNAVRQAVHRAVVEDLRGLLADDRKALKKAAIAENRTLIRTLPLISQKQIGRFLELVQEKCPTLTPRDLARTVEIWGKLEQSRSGYDLLKQLVSCAPEDLDTWNFLMEQWTAGNAEVVLGELDRRIKLIMQLQSLIRSKNTDEVHDLQPLFERGLWMFGPEYESVEFTSNQGMAHVVREFFQRRGAATSQRRPDFVALPDSSIGFYAADEFSDGEVSAIRKVLIVELKKGGFCLTQKELDQARDYAKELRATGSVQPTTSIEAYVLGASIESGLEEMKTGGIVVKPFPYDVLLNRAHTRVFNLARRIQDSKPALAPDVEIDDVLRETLIDFEEQADKAMI